MESNSKLTLSKTLEIAKQVEKAIREAKLMAGATQSENLSASVKYVSKSSNASAYKFTNKTHVKPSAGKKDLRKSSTSNSNNLKCFRCGSKSHLANSKNSKARTAKCHNYKKTGCFNAYVQFKDHFINSVIHVTEQGVSLLGLDLINALNLIFDGGQMEVRFTDANGVESKVSKNSFILDDKFADFNDCFGEDTGTIKGFVHEVKVKKDVKPVQQKLRRLPIAVKDAVSKELKRLESTDTSLLDIHFISRRIFKPSVGG
ncbi:hypothetical protein LOTGIDRAFT_163185 [Lottia gigantea]|uniref:Uncharacterized protein n=1 Tax=Lottia gigantea TaxID=225164 RepID=V3ZKG7_LOTGI|nr:hypothetical protein LOTGIDRAFT_163185 [Lottia gigantea]ESO91823.1 hypothetical protein LOTGIDRAFT_163185 [Lottia gigantea]